MKDTINKDQFRNWFRSNDTYKNNFSYEGLSALFDYLEEWEKSTDEELDFDPVALCCEYSEYDSFEEFQEDYDGKELYPTIDDLENYTTVIRVGHTGSFIIQQF
jgi:hypothetical protein